MRIIRKLVGSLSGYNLFIGWHIKKQLDYLQRIFPPDFKHRQMDDLGCGDGRITLLLEAIFQPSGLRGFDVNPSMVRRARKRGINAEVIDLNVEVPSGELAIIWGALHHLNDMESRLDKIKQNYNLIFIREPLNNKGVKLLETGHPLRKEELEPVFKRCLPGAQVFSYGDNILLFYTSPDLDN